MSLSNGADPANNHVGYSLKLVYSYTYIVIAYVGMAYTVKAHIVMAWSRPSELHLDGDGLRAGQERSLLAYDRAIGPLVQIDLVYSHGLYSFGSIVLAYVVVA